VRFLANSTGGAVSLAPLRLEGRLDDTNLDPVKSRLLENNNAPMAAIRTAADLIGRWNGSIAACQPADRPDRRFRSEGCPDSSPCLWRERARLDFRQISEAHHRAMAEIFEKLGIAQNTRIVAG